MGLRQRLTAQSEFMLCNNLDLRGNRGFVPGNLALECSARRLNTGWLSRISVPTVFIGGQNGQSASAAR
jgi:hypothetical protein